MSNILIPCPKCGSGLRLKDPSHLGKLGRCPKCANRFLLTEPEEVELELADASVPSTGTAAPWVPDDSAPFAERTPGSSRRSVVSEEPADDAFNFLTETEPDVRVTTNPVITVGMTFAEVTRLLGKPAKCKRMSDPAGDGHREYVVFAHKAGAYKLIFRDEKVAEIHSQPDVQAGAPSVTATRILSRRRRKNKMVGIALGGVLGICLAGILIYANQLEPPPQKTETPKKEKPKVNQTLVEDISSAEENADFAQKFAEENFATQGEPISFERIPLGTNLIVHLRPAELWSDEAKFAEFRASLTSNVTNWLESVIKKHCLFEPQEIEEVLFCLMLGGRGETPDIAVRVKLTQPRNKSEFLTRFGGMRSDEFGHPVYIAGNRAFLVERDTQTFASVPESMAGEMVGRQTKQLAATRPGIESIVVHTDKERHVTLVFQPFDMGIHRDVLMAENVRPIFDEILDWLDADDVETALWSMHLGDEQFFSRVLLRANHQWKPRQLERDVRNKLAALPAELYGAIRLMNPRQTGPRKIIGRFPAMMKAFSLHTLGGTSEDVAQFTTVLPAKAAPNLALGTLLAWNESTRTDFTKEPPKTQSNEPKLPDLVVDRLKLPMEVDFRRRPLQEAFDDIGEATSVKFVLDGEALKFAGYTQNMEQNFKLGEVPASEAIERILEQYEKMCVCITDEEKNIVTVMTFDAAKEKDLTPLKF